MSHAHITTDMSAQDMLWYVSHSVAYPLWTYNRFETCWSPHRRWYILRRTKYEFICVTSLDMYAWNVSIIMIDLCVCNVSQGICEMVRAHMSQVMCACEMCQFRISAVTSDTNTPYIVRCDTWHTHTQISHTTSNTCHTHTSQLTCPHRTCSDMCRIHSSQGCHICVIDTFRRFEFFQNWHMSQLTYQTWYSHISVTHQLRTVTHQLHQLHM